MNDIEILEDFTKGKIQQDKLEHYRGGYKMGFFYTKDLQQAIENLLKERQAYKDRIKELEEMDLTTVYMKGRQDKKVLFRVIINGKLKELDNQEKKELKGMKGQDRYAVKQEYQHKRSTLQELLGESYD